MDLFFRKITSRNKGLRNSFILSLVIHGLMFLIFVLSPFADEVYSSDDISIFPIDVDIREIPAEFFGGGSEPKKIDVKEWVEGSGNREETPDAPDTGRASNALSGSSEDGEGFLYSIHGDSAPVPIIRFNVNAYYPAKAKQANIRRKTVEVNIKVDEHGILEKAIVVSEPTGYGFDEAALKIINMARFRPGYKDGKRVKMNHTMAFTFELE
jgi:protein TonB